MRSAIFLSPSKTQAETGSVSTALPPRQLPAFEEQAAVLGRELADKDAEWFASHMRLSPVLAGQVARMWNSWLDPSGARVPAGWLYRGPAFTALDYPDLYARRVESESPPQKQMKPQTADLYILSAAYGLVRPADWIRPYRLDFTGSLLSPGGQSLLRFWQNTLQDFSRLLEYDLYIDLSSGEYSPLIPGQQGIRILRLDFRQKYSGGFKSVSATAKKLRGLFARHLISHPPGCPEEIRNLSLEGYRVNNALSDGETLVFTPEY